MSSPAPSQAQQGDLYRRLPAVDDLVRRVRELRGSGVDPASLLVAEARRRVDGLRRRITNGEARPDDLELDAAAHAVSVELDRLAAPSLRSVINASGVILHTNLGRAPLSASAARAVAAAAQGYSNLEMDLAAGRRGKRDVHTGDLLERMLGAPAVVVNNNAAAVLLTLNEAAAGAETIVSRGELVEIGDGFRIPDIMARSGTTLREVGTTNRTRIADYAAAVGDRTGALLRVHPSNFRIEGFTARPALRELVALGAERRLPVIEDLGSGCLHPLGSYGVSDEPTVQESLEAGVDLVTFSGDKLLGGPQAGIIVGSRDWVARVRRNPLFRALRADKLIHAALAATLRDYLFERFDDIPVLAMLRLDPAELRRRAEALAAALGASAGVQAGESLLGGGSTPQQTLPTYLLVVDPGAQSAASLDRALRTGDPPVVARVENDKLLLDLRTVAAHQDASLLERLRAVATQQ